MRTNWKLNDDTRGLGEPSITNLIKNFFSNHFRNEKKGFVARSKEWIKFCDKLPASGHFDDGNGAWKLQYTTHWLHIAKDILLVYLLGKGNNDHVFRH